MDEFDEEEKNNPDNLIFIVLDDYKNFPNYNHIETILSIEKFVILCYCDYNKINLNYIFNEENFEDNSVELFGKNFVINNKENCFLVINEKLEDLNRYINLLEIFNIKNINFPVSLEVKLIELGVKSITDMSFMFDGINTLKSKSDFSKFNTNNVSKMAYMFNNCSSLKELPDISNFDTSKVTDMSYMFCNCSSLISLSDMSNWNTKNLTDISNMFYNCESLILLPDISNWKVNNIKNMNNLFTNCKSLENVDFLSKWDIGDNTEVNDIWEGCPKLEINNKIYNRKKNKIINKIKIMIDKICEFLKRYILIFIGLGFILVTFKDLIFIFYPFYPLYYSFHLDKEKSIANNPIEFFHLNNNINITHIINSLNITNTSVIKEINEDKYKFINSYVNFTEINTKKNFDSDIEALKIINTIIGIIYPLNIFGYILMCFNSKYNFIKLNCSILLLSVLFLFNICLMIMILFDYIIIKRLLNSFKELFIRINLLFKTIISEDEIVQLKISLFTTNENIIHSIIIILINFCLCKLKTNKIKFPDKYREFFHNRNNNKNDLINEDNIN